MKKHILIIVVVAVFVLLPEWLEGQSRYTTTNISRREMVRDLEKGMRSFKKHHPLLYKYIGYEQFEKKYDSIIKNLPAEMLLRDFYILTADLVYSFGHGHTLLYPSKPNTDLFTRHTLSKLKYKIYNEELYITGSELEGSENIKSGTKIDIINGIDVKEMLRRYSNAIPFEGYTEALKGGITGKMLPMLLQIEYGDKDTLNLEMSYGDEKLVMNLPAYQLSSKIQGGFIEEFKKAMGRDLIIDSSGIYSSHVTLRFLDEEKNVAWLKVNDFMQYNSVYFDKVFAMLKLFETKHLILDLRDNLGGMLMLAGELQAYLSDSAFIFIDPPVVNKALNIIYMPGNHWIQHIASTIALPVLLAIYTPIRKYQDIGYSFNTLESRPYNPSAFSFSGSTTLLVNGGTYSAASILAANLKYGAGNLVIGAETGGASEGTVALKLKRIKLPHSGFWLSHGVGLLQPTEKGGEKGRGVEPDITIEPTPADYIDEIDPELIRAYRLFLENEE